MRLVHRGARLGGAATALLAALAAGAGAQNSNPTTSSASVLTGLPTSTCSDSKTAAPSSTPMTATCSGSEDTFSATASATATAGKNGSIQAGSSVTGFVFPLAIADGNASYYQYVTIGGGSLDNIFRIMLSSPVTIGITGTGTAEADLSVGPADSPVSPTVVRTSFATDPGTFALENYLYGTELGGGDTFFFMLFARGSVGTAQPGDFDASASVDFPAPSITLYDKDNVDITDRYTLAYDPDAAPVSSVPEPASLTLLATGLAGVVGVARRKRGALKSTETD